MEHQDSISIKTHTSLDQKITWLGHLRTSDEEQLLPAGALLPGRKVGKKCKSAFLQAATQDLRLRPVSSAHTLGWATEARTDGRWLGVTSLSQLQEQVSTPVGLLQLTTHGDQLSNFKLRFIGSISFYFGLRWGLQSPTHRAADDVTAAFPTTDKSQVSSSLTTWLSPNLSPPGEVRISYVCRVRFNFFLGLYFRKAQ